MNDRNQADPWAWSPPPEGPVTPAGPGAPPPGHVPPAGTNGLAIASLVLSLFWCYWVGSVLAVVFGHVALAQIRRSGGAQTGRGLAVAGLVVGWLSIAVGVVLAVVLAVFWDDFDDSDERDGTGVVANRGEVAATDVRVGDCLQLPEGERVYTVEVVPCSERHEAEMYAVWRIAGSSYPGDARVGRTAEAGCAQRFRAYVGKPYARSELEMFMLYPNGPSWRFHDDREVSCWVTQPGDEPYVGSLRSSRR